MANWQDANNSQVMIRNMLETSELSKNINQAELQSQLNIINSLIKTNQENQSTKLEIIETNTISLKNELKEIEQLIQDSHSNIIENINFNQKELYEIHAQTNQLMEDIRSQEDAQNKHSNELANEMENQNKKMLNSIKETLEKHTTQIISNQREIQTKENDFSITNWNNQKKNTETSLKALDQLTKTTNKILITSQEHNETNNTLMEKATEQEATFNFLIKETKDTKELMKIMKEATEIIPIINASIDNHINTYEQTKQYKNSKSITRGRKENRSEYNNNKNPKCTA
jgi:hypothetical protein